MTPSPDDVRDASVLLGLRERGIPVRVRNGCYEYRGALHPSGWVRLRGRSGARFVWTLAFGEEPRAPKLWRRCRNRLCLRVSHYSAVHPDHQPPRPARVLKLSAERARRIRERHRDGARVCDLARAYGVHQATVHDVLAGRAWKETTSARRGAGET
jgi:hypothetical protein